MSNTNSKITKVNVPKRIVDETGFTPETVRKYLRLIESPTFNRIATAYKKVIQEAVEEKTAVIDNLIN